MSPLRCHKTPFAETKERSKLKRHMQTGHADSDNKPREFFRSQRRRNEVKKRERVRNLVKFITVSTESFVSYLLLCRISQYKKPQ